MYSFYFSFCLILIWKLIPFPLYETYYFMLEIKNPGTIFFLRIASVSFTFQDLTCFSQVSLQLLRIIFTLCMIKNYFVQSVELKALQFSQLASDYCSIAFTFLPLLLNIASIFCSKEVINFYNLFFPTWITSNMPLRDYGSSVLVSGGAVQTMKTNTTLSSLSEGLENSIW